MSAWTIAVVDRGNVFAIWRTGGNNLPGGIPLGFDLRWRSLSRGRIADANLSAPALHWPTASAGFGTVCVSDSRVGDLAGWAPEMYGSMFDACIEAARVVWCHLHRTGGEILRAKGVTEMSRDERAELAVKLRALGATPDARFHDVDPGPLDERLALRTSEMISDAELERILRSLY